MKLQQVTRLKFDLDDFFFLGGGGGGEWAQNEFFKFLKKIDAFNFYYFLY